MKYSIDNYDDLINHIPNKLFKSQVNQAQNYQKFQGFQT